MNFAMTSILFAIILIHLAMSYIGEHGQLGHNDRVNKLKPTLVQALEGVFVSQITCGWSHSVALTAKGKVFTWYVKRLFVGVGLLAFLSRSHDYSFSGETEITASSVMGLVERSQCHVK